VQINPIWQWGPYDVALGTNGAQPDWYLGWLIGALRLMPGFDVTIGDYTLVPNPFWGGALFPLIVVAVMLLIPFAEGRLTGDRGPHNVLDRPRDAPGRTAFGLAFLTWVVLIFVAGSADRATVFFGADYETQMWIYRALVVFAPFVVFVIARRVCRELQLAERLAEDRRAAEDEAEQVSLPVSPVG
jgi:ubiquinol-cytochrome c reductase cytochrome b subunit